VKRYIEIEGVPTLIQGAESVKVLHRKEKNMIQLSNESETLFIPLYGKALMSRTL